MGESGLAPWEAVGMVPRAFITRRIPEEGLKMLRTRVEITLNEEERVLSKEEIIGGVGGCQGLLCLLADTIDAEVMDAADLRVISNYAVGFDNIDVDAASQRGILVTNTTVTGLSETPADFTFALMLGLARRVCEGDRMVREGRFVGWDPMLLLGADVHGKTIGIVGAGRIGAAVARRAKGFDMRTLYSDVRSNLEMESEFGATRVALNDLLAESDFVTLHVPLTPETQHLIGREQLRRMRRTALLVNTSRGPVVDESALADALARGEIAGAALDVYENEPSVHQDLLTMENVLLLPHMASASLETRTQMAVAAAQNLLDGLEGRRPRFMVNPEVLSYRTRE